MKALREEYQSLCQKFEELKTLARINLDLLFLTVNKVESPQAWVELNKVNDLVQAVLAGWEESSKVESSTLILSDHKPPLMDTTSIDRYLDEMALSFTQQEVMDAFNRFLERSSLKEVSSTPGFTPSEDQEQSNSAALPHGSDINGAACVKAEIGEGSHQDVDGVSDNSVGAVDRIPAGDMTDVMEMDDQTEDNPEGSQKESGTLDLESPTGRSGLDCVPVVNDDPDASKVSIAWEVVIIPDAPSESDGKDEKPSDLPPSWEVAMVEATNEQMAIQSLLEEFGIPMSLLDPGSHKVCPICSKEYKVRYKFLDHLKSHKRERDREENLHDSPTAFQMAMLETTEQIAVKNLLEEFNLPSSVLDSGSTKICPICSKEYKLKNKFFDHLKNHKQERDQEESRGESKPESFLCTICGKTLNGKSSLKSHVNLHKVMEKGEYFKCQICDKEYLGKRNLKRHIFNTHTLKKAFMCDICGKGYTNKHYFQVHQKYVHSDVKPEQCQVCKKMLSSKDSLVRHMRIHRGELPYSCSICGKRFRSITNKHTHEVVVHTGNFPHRCLLCDHRGFITPGQLRIHEQKYHSQGEGDTADMEAAEGKKKTPYRKRRLKRFSMFGEPLEPLKCETCGKEFKHSKSLYRHEFIHTGVKPHKCSVCGRCFSIKEHLDRHLWTHSDVKKYTCDLCGKGFNDKPNYVSHVRRLHPEHAGTMETPSVSKAAPPVQQVQQVARLLNMDMHSDCLDYQHQQHPVPVILDGRGSVPHHHSFQP